MRNKPIQADQLIPTSSTPPPEAGFYRIDRHTIGVVGNMSFRDPDTQVVMPVGKGAIPFPDFVPRVLASLVASSTAACTSGVVTVSATAHGVPSTYADGFEIYYPGSPTLASGWYKGMTRTSADAITFLAPASADFLSESVNGGAAFIAEVTFYTLNIPGNTLKIGDLVSCRVTTSGPGAGTKTIALKYAGTSLGRNTQTTNRVTSDIGFAVSGVAKQSGNIGTLGTAGTVLSGTVDMTAAQDLTLTVSSASAGGVIIIHAAKVSVI